MGYSYKRQMLRIPAIQDHVRAALLERDREIRRPHRIVGERTSRAELNKATPLGLRIQPEAEAGALQYKSA